MSGCNPGGYSVKCIHSTCLECTPFSNDVNICKEPQCVFLCPHMYTCDGKCYDYNNGHVCKHVHRVHSLSKQNLPRTPSHPEPDNVHNIKNTWQKEEWTNFEVSSPNTQVCSTI